MSKTIKVNSLTVGIKLIVLLAVVGSLYFQLVKGFYVCSLCWWQRIFWYPQLLVWLLPFRLKDKVQYSLVSSLLGLPVALYHYYIQMVTQSQAVISCGTASYGLDCAVKQLDILGFITIPFLSALGYFTVIVLSLLWIRTQASPKPHNS